MILNTSYIKYKYIFRFNRYTNKFITYIFYR